MNAKRIAALMGVILLFLMYALTLVFALMGSENTVKFFMISLVSTIMVPIIIHLFLMMLNARKGKNVMDETYSYKKKKEKEDGV